MKAALKLAARRLLLRWLRKLVDLVDDRLHAAEVRFRSVPAEEPASQRPQLEKASKANPFPVAAPRVKRMRRHVTAADFDRRFA